MRIIFIRHGDPDYKKDSLTEKGWREARLLAERVSRWEVDDFYCSPLGRARDTASCSLEKMGRTAETFRFLREFEGRVLNPATGRDGICWDLMPEYWTNSEEMYDRNNWALSDIMLGSPIDINEEWRSVCGGIDDILARYGYVRNGSYYKVREHSDKTIVIFCHFGVTMVMMSHLLGIAAPVLLHGFFLPPTSVTILNAEERTDDNAYFRCQIVGDVTHLHMGKEPVSESGYFAEAFQEYI